MSTAHDAIDRIRQVADPAYLGGLDAQEQALSRQLADEIAPMLSGETQACAPLDPMQGELIGRVSPPQIDEVSKSLPEPLRAAVALVINGTPVQSATAAYAIGLVGRKAASAAIALAAITKRTPWVGEALRRIDCQAWEVGGFDAIDPKPTFTAPLSGKTCVTSQLRWLFQHALDGRRWPPGFIETASGDIATLCQTKTKDALSAEVRDALLRTLTDAEAAPSLRGAWLTVLADHVAIPPELVAPIEELAGNVDETVSWPAQRALVASGSEQGARQFARWLDADTFHWAWEDSGAVMRPHVAIVLPALARALHSPTWTNRAAAMRVLGELDSPATVPTIAGAIRSTDWLTAQAAANALAPLAHDNADAARTLEALARDYWSGRVRSVAALAKSTGRGVRDDPFGCGGTPEQVQNSEDNVSLGCISLHYGGPVDHRLPRCRDREPTNGRYRDESGRIERIRWTFPSKGQLPRVGMNALSTWCKVGDMAPVLATDDGWLVGCQGFEAEGMLGFVPKYGEAKVVPIRHFGTSVIVRVGARIFAAGDAPFEFDEAGVLYELKRDAAHGWTTEAVAALPSPPAGYAVLGDRIAFVDALNTTVLTPGGELSALTCMH